MTVLEKEIEAALVKRVEKELGGMCEKFTSGRRSVPDRIITLPGGRIIFVELKAPGKTPSRLQERDHKRRRDMGCEVRVIDTLEDARAFEP